MYANASLLQQAVAHNGLGRAGRDLEARRRGGQAFWKARTVGMWKRFWHRLAGRSCALLDLDEALTNARVAGRSYVGIRQVPIDRIWGSEGRVEDFDAGFYPLQSHNMDRWVSVAAARQMGISLPPVELVQIGEVYYVRDGHHRISVAKALGQKEIEAEVTLWQLA
jgi:hypothetical protein